MASDAPPSEQQVSEQQACVSNLLAMQPEQFKEIVLNALQRKPKNQREEIVKLLDDAVILPIGSGVSSGVRNHLWKVIIWGFTIILGISALGLVLGMFFLEMKDGAIKPELILAVFTSVVGFLSGVFVQSPNASGRDQAPPPG